MQNINHYKVDISTKTIWRVVIMALLLIFLFEIKEILGIIFIAWVLASAVNPLVDKLQRQKIPRFLSILVIYLVLLFLLCLVFFILIPPIIDEIAVLGHDFPKYSKPIVNFFNDLKQTSVEYGYLDNVEKAIDSFGNSLTNLTSGIYSAATNVITAIAMVVTILVITFYMTIEEEGIKKLLQLIIPANYQPYVLQKINQIQSKLGSWLWGEMILMTVIGSCTGIALTLIGVPYALVLAIFAGFCEFIPYIGPIISVIPALLFSLTVMGDSPLKPILVIIAYIIIQQLENHLLVPKIMNKAVGLNPIIVIVTILIGAKLWGIAGVLLAVPAATILSIFIEDFFTTQKIEANKLEGEEYINKL